MIYGFRMAASSEIVIPALDIPCWILDIQSFNVFGYLLLLSKTRSCSPPPHDSSALLTFEFYNLKLMVTIIKIVMRVYCCLNIPKVGAWLV
jgi:hypothetical protein